MIKKVMNFILKDIANARRDNIILYMIFAPLMIAVILKFFIPSLEGSSLTFAVNSCNTGFIEKLEEYGQVIEMDSYEKVKARVNENDDTVGIIGEDGKFRIILEGNEREEFGEAALVIIDDILKNQDSAEYKYTVLGDKRSLISEYFAIMLIIMSILMSGMMIGFNIIEEKESGAIRAISVTPLRMSEYIFARGIIVLFFSLLLSVASSIIILGFDISYIKLLIGVVFSSGIGVMLGIVIGGAADNQIKGIAIVKAITLPFTLIPVASIFIPQRYQIFMYPFPNYWMYRIFKNVFIDRNNNADYWISNSVTLVLTIILIFIIVFALKKKIKLR